MIFKSGPTPLIATKRGCTLTARLFGDRAVRTQVHGTCLGFEALAVVVSSNDTILGK